MPSVKVSLKVLPPGTGHGKDPYRVGIPGLLLSRGTAFIMPLVS